MFKLASLVCAVTSLLSAAGFPVVFEDHGSRFTARGKGFSLELDKTGALVRHGASALRMRVAGGRETYIRGESRGPGSSSYLIGRDPSKWRTGLTHWNRVRYSDVLPGVDLVYHGKQGRLEYDFEIAPGVNPLRIVVEFDGAKKLRLDKNGDLLIGTAAGEIRQLKPVAYQGERTVEASYRIAGRDQVAFVLGDYDRT